MSVQYRVKSTCELNIIRFFSYCMSKNSCLVFIVYSLYTDIKYFLDIQYVVLPDPHFPLDPTVKRTNLYFRGENANTIHWFASYKGISNFKNDLCNIKFRQYIIFNQIHWLNLERKHYLCHIDRFWYFFLFQISLVP